MTAGDEPDLTKPQQQVLDLVADFLFVEGTRFVAGLEIRRRMPSADRETKRLLLQQLVPAYLKLHGSVREDSYSLTPFGALHCKHSSTARAFARALHPLAVASFTSSRDSFTWNELKPAVQIDGRALTDDDLELVRYVLFCMGVWGASGLTWSRPPPEQLEDLLEIQDTDQLFLRVHEALLEMDEATEATGMGRSFRSANGEEPREDYRTDRTFDPRAVRLHAKAIFEQYFRACNRTLNVIPNDRDDRSALEELARKGLAKETQNGGAFLIGPLGVDVCMGDADLDQILGLAPAPKPPQPPPATVNIFHGPLGAVAAPSGASAEAGLDGTSTDRAPHRAEATPKRMGKPRRAREAMALGKDEQPLGAGVSATALPPGSLAVLRAAIRAVPATKYALGVAGVGAAAAIVLGLLGSPTAAVVGVTLGLAFSTVLLVFANLARQKPTTFLRPAIVVLWSATLLFVATLVALFSSFFFDVPLHLRPSSTRLDPAGGRPARDADPRGSLSESSASASPNPVSSVTSASTSRKRSGKIAAKFRDALASRFRDNGWIVTDANYLGIEPWTQTQALASLLSERTIDARLARTLESGLDVVHRSRLSQGWKSDIHAYFNVEPPLYATWAFCQARARGLSVPVDEPEEVWRIAGKYSDELGRWTEVPDHYDVPSVYATSLAALTMLECRRHRALDASVLEARLERAINWLIGSQSPRAGLPSWKPDRLAASPMLGVTLFTSYVLMRAHRELHVTGESVDFKTVLPRVLEFASDTASDFVASDSYIFGPERVGKAPFSHTVRFLRNPWALACASEWLHQYETLSDRATVSSVSSTWGKLLNTADQATLLEAQSWQIAEYLFALNVGSAD